jgi:hypothetical protein
MMAIRILLLVALVGAVCWLAVETRRVHLALAVYAAALQHWQRMLQEFESHQKDRR